MTGGKVYLVGAGPGDPGLLTVKGRRCLEEADAVVYDRLLSPRLLSLARSDAALYYVGKASSAHTVKQDDIESLLVRLAEEGKTVVRLKGGDPFVFGRGGEEAAALALHGIAWEIVPGVTSAVSVPAYAGIPVTHRSVSPSFTVVTGHRCQGSADSVGWATLAGTEGTLVILMGVSHLPDIVQALTAHGRPLDTPVALVRWGTRAAHQTLTGTLYDIVNKVKAVNFQSPACIVVGSVVNLRDELSWYECLPLFGRKVLVTADTCSEANEMAQALEALGAETLTAAVEQFAVADMQQIADAVSVVDGAQASCQGILFTSSLGVELFFQHWLAAERDIRRLADIEFGATHHNVSKTLRRYGIVPSVVSHAAETRTGVQEALQRMRASVLVEVPPASLGFNEIGSHSEAVSYISMFSLAQSGQWSEIVRTWLADGCDAVWAGSPVSATLAGSYNVPKLILAGQPADFVVDFTGAAKALVQGAL